MKTERIVALLLVLLGLAPLAMAEDRPEIAYRILSSYVDQKEAAGAAGGRIAGSILTTGGGLMMAGGFTAWFYGDQLAAAAGGTLDYDTKLGLTFGLGIGGTVLSGIGIGLLVAEPHDFRLEYGEVFSEDDPDVREAMSVAVLRDLAIKGKTDRVTGALSSLLVPLVTGAIKAGINVSEGKLWSEGVWESVSWSSWSIVGGITGLLSTSEEERLYEKYLAGREAIYGAFPKGK